MKAICNSYAATNSSGPNSKHGHVPSIGEGWLRQEKMIPFLSGADGEGIHRLMLRQ